MNIELLPKQLEFLRCDKEETLFLGGVGSGKTFVGCLWLIEVCMRYPGVDTIMASLTYKSLKKTNVPYVQELLLDVYNMVDGKDYKYYKGDQYFLFPNGSKIWMATQENAQSHFKSCNIGACLLDEVGAWSETAFDLIFGRMRAAPGMMRFISSPEGYNHLYEHFVTNFDPETMGFIKATTYDNPTLPDRYIERMRRRYSKKKFLQECMAEFIDLYDGQCLPSFDRRHNVLSGKQYQRRPKILPENTVVWLDWNRTPFCAAFATKKPNGDIEIFDEIRLEGANTSDMGKEIQRRYPHDWDRLIIRADHTNANQMTSTITSDTNYSVLEEMGFTTEFVLNPSVRASTDNVDRLLDQTRLYIWEHCVYCISDCAQVIWNSSGTGPDKERNKNITHLFDVIRYICWFIDNPQIKRTKKHSKEFRL